MNALREYYDVHDAHCCKQHGCKYGDADCSVFAGNHKGIRCEFCDMFEDEVKNMTEVDLEVMVESMTEMQQMILLRLLEKTRSR